MTDKELAELLPRLPFERQMEEVIAKFVSGITSRHHDGHTSAALADPRIARDLIAKLKRFGVLAAGECEWRINGDGAWQTTCDLWWGMDNDATPVENQMHYCPKCGKRLVVKATAPGERT